MNKQVKLTNGDSFCPSSLNWSNSLEIVSERPVKNPKTKSHLPQSHCNSPYVPSTGLLSFKRGRKQSTYNCSNRFGYVWKLDIRETRLVNKLVYSLMTDGKRTYSYAIVFRTFCLFFQAKPNIHVITLLTNAIENIKPTCEVKKVRITGTTRNVPKIIAKERQETLAFRWIIEAAVKRNTINGNGQSLSKCLSAEILDAYHKRGNVRKKRDDLHELAEANKSFVHYRWW